MRRFFDILLLKPFSTLSTKEIYLRYLWRMFSYIGIIAVTVVLLLIISIFSGCESQIKESKVKSQYYSLVYPEDTIIYGVVKSISTQKMKKHGHFLYYKSNNVIIQSDTLIYSVCFDKMTFDVNDSVKIVIERVKHEGEFNDILTTIYPSFGEKSETYWRFENLYYKELMLDEIKKIE